MFALEHTEDFIFFLKKRKGLLILIKFVCNSIAEINYNLGLTFTCCLRSGQLIFLLVKKKSLKCQKTSSLTLAVIKGF